ncbi:MAG: D-alanine--D-alanine ligase [Clostridia bacterium]|nr:D-alanine--D-alanine ligase [Clostridia bacterium]
MVKNLLVIFGGCSSEYSVSLRSAASVLRNLDSSKYNVITLGITKDGAWYLYNGDVDSIENDCWFNDEDTTPAILSPDKNDKALIVLNDMGAYEKIAIDVIFPVLHGKNGEDGTIQGIFELAGIPYVGCGLLASGMCMDKAVTNTLADAAGIDGAKWAAFTETEYREGRVNLAAIEEKLGYPIFVKPANAGSSVGISKAHNHMELLAALDIAFQNDYKAVLEETLVGREIECAVMGNTQPVASCIGEILPTAEFYDFDAKYIDNSTGLAIPADLPESVSEKVRAAAVNAYRTLGCEGLSRVDFFLCNDGRICLNEINTLPGFTSISMFPKLFGQVGIPYAELLDRLIEYAEERAK